MRGAVNEGGDVAVFAGVDDGPGDGSAAVKVVKTVRAKGGGAEGTGDAGVGGQVEVGLSAGSGEEVALQASKIGIKEIELGAEKVGGWLRLVKGFALSGYETIFWTCLHCRGTRS